MTEHAAFIQVINESPDDNAPRLVYADWLEEQGNNARAEFIRLQVERSALPFWDARQIPMLVRENKLLGLYGLDWRQELPKLKGIGWGAFQRGFVAHASFRDFQTFRNNAKRCWAAAPLSSIAIGDWPEDPIDNIEPIDGLKELSISQTTFHERPLRQLADAPLLSTLDVINLHHCSLGADGLREILFSPYINNLKALRVPYNSLGGPGIDVLLGSESLKSLTELDLSEQDSYARYEEDPVIKAGDLEQLAHSPIMSQIQSLTLSGNEAGADGLGALLKSSRAANLKTLRIRANGLTSPAMHAFADATSEMRLDVLDLGQNMLRDAGATPLAKADCLRELKVLNLDRCEITQEGAATLCHAPFIHSLRRLNVNENSLGEQGVSAILNAEPDQLHTLQVGFNQIGIEGVVELAQSLFSRQLQALDLSRNGLDDDSVNILIESKNFESLRLLHLARNSVTGPAMAALTRSDLWKQLVVFDSVEHDDLAIPFTID